MRHAIATSVEIPVSAERVWSVLMDFARYPEWNPFVRSIEGVPSIGSRLKVTIQPPGGKAMSFRPVVLQKTEGREFRWKGILLFRGLFDGEHYFKLVPGDGGSTVFTHGEDFAGLLVPLFRSTLDGKTKTGFEAMNNALKQRLTENPRLETKV
jgi:hypothetical protein